MVEHGPEKAGVPSSSLGLGTISYQKSSGKSSNERHLASSRCTQHRNYILSYERRSCVFKRSTSIAKLGVRGDNPVENYLEKAPKGHFAVDKFVVRSAGIVEQTTNRPRDLLDPHVVHKHSMARILSGCPFPGLSTGARCMSQEALVAASSAGPSTAGADSCPRPGGSRGRFATGHASRGPYRPRPTRGRRASPLDPGARSSIRSGR